MSLQHKNLLITGAGRGIGAATAELAVERGAGVAICARSEKELAFTADDIKRKFSNANIFWKVVDLQDTQKTLEFYDEAEKVLGPITGLVNNAAILIAEPTEKNSVEAAKEIFAINVIAPFILSKEFFVRRKQKKQSGSIVNVGSVAGLQGFEKFPGLVLYSSTKAALVGMTEAMALEGRDCRIRVNLVAPGATDTRMLNEAFPDVKANLKPIDIARSILYFIDDEESGAITGSIMAASD